MSDDLPENAALALVINLARIRELLGRSTINGNLGWAPRIKILQLLVNIFVDNGWKDMILQVIVLARNGTCLGARLSIDVLEALTERLAEAQQELGAHRNCLHFQVLQGTLRLELVLRYCHLADLYCVEVVVNLAKLGGNLFIDELKNLLILVDGEVSELAEHSIHRLVSQLYICNIAPLDLLSLDE